MLVSGALGRLPTWHVTTSAPRPFAAPVIEPAQDWSGAGLQQAEELEEQTDQRPMSTVPDWSGSGLEQALDVDLSAPSSRERRKTDIIEDYWAAGAGVADPEFPDVSICATDPTDGVYNW
eukprot:jgi/Chrzof1/4402/Cz14g11230.t1